MARIALTYRMQRDTARVMLTDTTVALQSMRANQPGIVQKAEKKAFRKGFFSGIKWTTVVSIAVYITRKLRQ